MAFMYDLLDVYIWYKFVKRTCHFLNMFGHDFAWVLEDRRTKHVQECGSALSSVLTLPGWLELAGIAAAVTRNRCAQGAACYLAARD